MKRFISILEEELLNIFKFLVKCNRSEPTHIIPLDNLLKKVWNFSKKCNVT